ncbi:hypothetical protein RB653_009095 [Dictyostelium firmibasis]|uniref:Ricin B lectin domain-containing protein n=1 Tax=Dictyostelium firmibasis TaxID=79012 RepID=A0AAN7YX38_9MYCE
MINIENISNSPKLNEEKPLNSSPKPKYSFAAKSFFQGPNNDQTYYLSSGTTSKCIASESIQTWLLSDDGHIYTSNGEYVLDLSSDGYYVQLSTINSKSTQLWTINKSTNKIQNKGNGKYLDINCYNICVSDLNDNATQLWTTIRRTPIPFGNWGYFQSKQLDSNNNCWGLSVLNGSSSYNTSVVMNKIQAKSKGQIWQMTSDGHILSRLDGNLVLDVGPAISSNSYQLDVNVYKPNDVMQTWGINENNQIFNKHFTNLCIGFVGELGIDSTINCVIAEPTNSSDINFQWNANPTYSLNRIVNEDPVPFPPYTSGDLLASYQYLSQFATSNQSNDIRSLYTNINVSLQTFFTLATVATCPPSIQSTEDFTNVQNQIKTELSYAINVRLVFSHYSGFYSEIFSKSSADLENLANLCSVNMSSDQYVNGNYTDAVTSVFYTVISEIPIGGPIIANIAQSAVDFGEDSEGGDHGPSTYQVTLSNLFNHLNSNYNKEMANAQNMKDIILKDWGMMSKTNQLCFLPINDPSSLNVDGLNNELISDVASTAYEIAMIQMLLPISYQIYFTPSGSVKFPYVPITSGDYAWTDNSGTYILATITHNNSYPPKALTDKLWKNGVSMQEFFTSSYDWNLARALTFYSTPGNSGNSDRLFKLATPTVKNLTPMPMTFYVKNGSDLVGTFQSPTHHAGYSPNTYSVGCAGHHLLFVKVNDINGNDVASFNVYIDFEVLSGSYVSIQPGSLLVAQGYVVGTPICNQGSFSETFTASILVPIYQSN